MTLLMLQPKLAVFKVVEFAAATASAKAQFLQLVPAYLDLRVQNWDIVEQRSVQASAEVHSEPSDEDDEFLHD